MTNMETAAEPVNVFDLEAQAKAKLTPLAFDYYAGGACDEKTLSANVTAYADIWLRPRMLVDVSKRDLTTTVLDQHISAPIVIAPLAFQRLAHAQGELATVRAAGKFGTIMILSTLATHSIEEVAAEASGNLWFQLYVYKDRGITRRLVERAEAAGCKALVITLDSTLLGRRERDVRNNFHLPHGLSCKNLEGMASENFPQTANGSGLATYINSLYDTSLTWKDFAWFKSITKLPVLAKGILRADDAHRAIEHGAEGIIVSNHGGRQLDTTIPTIKALPEVIAAVDGRTEVYVDGGIRRGTDILKCIAYGARAVLIGRPVLWGLTVGGEAGVGSVLEMLRAELDLSMGLSGCPSVNEITPDLLYTNGTREQ